MRLGRPTVALLVASIVVAGTPIGAVAGERGVTAPAAERRITLEASPARVRFGGSVRLSGRARPASAGERVRIVDQDGRVRARATTDRRGRYSTALAPRRRTRVRALWSRRASPSVWLRVRPLVRARLHRVRLFGRARVGGVVRPGHDRRRVTVRLFRNGDLIRKRRVPLDGARFATRFYIGRPGSYRSKATFDDHDHLRTSDRSTRRRTRLPRLGPGARGARVKLLERRLRRLRYFIRGVNRRYDYRTADAVRAFNKVQGRRRVSAVTESTWRALARPKRPRPRGPKRGFRIEIDQTKQVLYTVRRGRVRRILHTSTGRGGITRDGVWRVFRKIRGYSPGRLYYPSYFDGLRAIHGWPEVPVSAASHGCARVPMWAAKWIYGRARIGTEVRIYH